MWQKIKEKIKAKLKAKLKEWFGCDCAKSVVINNTLSAELISSYLNTKDGQRALINLISNNRGRISDSLK